jgi:hypothetical protein
MTHRKNNLKTNFVSSKDVSVVFFSHILFNSKIVMFQKYTRTHTHTHTHIYVLYTFPKL